MKRCPWCKSALRKATPLEVRRLRERATAGVPRSVKFTLHRYERCTSCSWSNVHATYDGRVEEAVR